MFRTLCSRIVAGLVVLVGAAPAFADGKVFSRVEAVPVIPDQQALIHFADGKETLVIETRFIGKGTDFAWVVPLPSVPEVTPSTRGLFPTLQVLFAPQVEDRVDRYWLLALATLALAISLAMRRFDFCLAVLMMVGCYNVVIPTLGSARGLAGSTESVTVHERRTVGAYDVATISSDKTEALMDWLTGNGFHVDPAAAPVIADYVTEGWTFAAARLQRDADTNEPMTPHPLAFTFATAKPVYPLRLTGVGQTSPCRIDVFVFGHQRADVPGFETRHCEQPEYPSPAVQRVYWLSPPALLTVVHPELRRLVKDAPVATYLSAELTPDQMREDAWLNWSPFQAQHTTLYTEKGALTTTLNRAVPVLCVLVFIAWLLARRGHVRPATAARVAVGITLATGAVAGWMYVALPRTEVTWKRLRWPIAYRLKSELLSLLTEHPDKASDLAWLQAQAAQLTANRGAPAPSSEDDAPGDFHLRMSGSDVEYVWHDLVGGRHVERLQPEAGNSSWGFRSRPASAATAPATSTAGDNEP